MRQPPTPIDVAAKRRIMDEANARGLTLDGIRVRVAGAALPFAEVYAEDSTTRRQTMVGQYSWGVIAHALTRNGELR